ncbi:hypothetical protein EDD16DRAFT_1826596 [Pisolithus croceorrhizus]|nr:hypothetical protein EV401DRAFT_2260523 [Pisolithus croceorrhizus]KAI6125080.1 hypothetical protein EDD16DRAFT_1826596 [Pisolithus croceorrhizus]KAI6168170.1 hypothetical protein EDD17DRAFT_1773196 [Pisolithus thermaeus]
MIDAFFYGTLMHPKILQRVIGNDGSHLRICPAVIKDFTRHQIKGADYPAIVPYSLSRSLFDHDLGEDQKSVRGSLISGLTDEDIRLLDVFEGDEYIREVVVAYPLGPLISLCDVPPANMMGPLVPTTVASQGLEPERTMNVHTYVWCMSTSELGSDPWTFEDFVRQNAWKWVGAGSEGNTDYAEVDKQREMERATVGS